MVISRPVRGSRPLRPARLVTTKVQRSSFSENQRRAGNGRDARDRGLADESLSSRSLRVQIKLRPAARQSEHYYRTPLTSLKWRRYSSPDPWRGGVAMELGLLLLVGWIVGAFLSAFVASQKGRDPLGWAALAFIFSPLIILIALAAVPPLQTRSSPTTDLPAGDSPRRPARNVTDTIEHMSKKCPQCAERIKFEALVCRYCNHRFVAEEVRKEIEAVKLDLEQTSVVAEPVVEWMNCPKCGNLIRPDPATGTCCRCGFVVSHPGS